MEPIGKRSRQCQYHPHLVTINTYIGFLGSHSSIGKVAGINAFSPTVVCICVHNLKLKWKTKYRIFLVISTQFMLKFITILAKYKYSSARNIINILSPTKIISYKHFDQHQLHTIHIKTTSFTYSCVHMLFAKILIFFWILKKKHKCNTNAKLFFNTSFLLCSFSNIFLVLLRQRSNLFSIITGFTIFCSYDNKIMTSRFPQEQSWNKMQFLVLTILLISFWKPGKSSYLQVTEICLLSKFCNKTT